MSSRPTVTLRPGIERGLARGLPWVYERQVAWDDHSRALRAGTIVEVLDSRGQAVATAAVDPAATIALRCWAHEPGVVVDADLLERRIRAALALRERLYDAPWYRLLHADADGLPGVVCDRFGDVLVVELGPVASAVRGPLHTALRAVLEPRSLVLRHSGARELGGEPLPPRLELQEHGARYLLDLEGGQKTGWYYDQRPHRAFAARCARGTRVLDAFCYTGGFAIQAALAGARSVLAMDRSAPALALAQESIERNGLADSVSLERADVMEALPAMADGGPRFELAILDPPPLAKRRETRGGALAAHRHLARSAAALLTPGGVLIQASCSHAVAGDKLTKALLQGLGDAGRRGTIIHRGGAGPDHPLHPLLPQSRYLDVVGLRLL